MLSKQLLKVVAFNSTTALLHRVVSPVRVNIVQRRHQTNLNGLPFRTTREQANEGFANHKRFLEESNGIADTKALDIYKKDPVKACFVPFHSADVKNIGSSYVGEYGRDRTVPIITTSVDANGNVSISTTYTTVTDWDRCQGDIHSTDYPFGTTYTQIYADFIYPRVLIEKILPTPDVVQIAALTEKMISDEKNKRVVFPHSMNMSLALEKLSARLYDLEHSRVSDLIKRKHSADHARIHSLDVHMQDAQFNLFSYHIPAYIYESRIGDYANYKIINAHSGEIYGNKIYSILKSAIFGAGMGGGLAFAASLATRPYILAAQIAVRVVIAAISSGMLSGGLAHFRNVSNNYNFQFTTKTEKEQNNQYPESDDDIARREYAAKMNKENDYTVKSEHIRFPTDKCKLFGLNPERDITPDILKAAYHRKVKTWHPDLFSDQNSKKKAEAMTQQLNDAYKEMQDIWKENTPKNK